ncbi:MAG: FkbM family methyltransferase [Alphaproteobacteria bacterium]|nr:FkbM family methyltransferase [Alphaproteobacteria bacterium]
MRPAKTLLRGPDGQPLLPSATRRADGTPRFLMPLLPPLIESDDGIRHLVDRELNYDGFERPTRDIIDAHLEAGDLFLDIGAHWGALSLSAITAPAADVHAIAVEPAPLNLTMLLRAIILNRVADSLIAVATAAGQEAGLAGLRFASTMGNAITTQCDWKGRSGLQVPVISIDRLLKDLKIPAQQRIVMKIDVEGLEPEVLRGAAATIETGRVALIIWERGQEYRSDAGVRARAIEVSRWLAGLGYRHYTLPYHEWGGPLIPATDDWFFSNIFSFAPDVQKRDVYPQAFAGRPPYETVHRMQRSPERMATVTNMCIEAGSSDGIRWADPAQLQPGAETRAAAAARFIEPGSRILDVGCGAMALSRHLPSGCTYIPADLIARSDDCVVVDLNQGHFPSGSFDVVAVLEVLEYVHDIDGLLRKCRTAAPRLILGYRPLESGSPNQRRSLGFFNDLRVEDVEAALKNAGYGIAQRIAVASSTIWCCEAA